MDRIDEAAVIAMDARRRSYGRTTLVSKEAQDFEAMRAALLAGVKVLLGEPVGWLAGSEHFYNEESARMYLAVGRKAGKPIALYAPSLGEGDGR